MLGLGLGIGVAQTAPLRRYSIGGKAPAVVADYSSGIYGLNGTPAVFNGLFSFSRLSAAWKLNALGHWVKALAGEPRTGHHIWKDGKLVPAGQLVESATRTQEFSYSKLDDASLGSTFQTLGSDVTIQGGSTDIVTEVVATGTENGIPYIDWSISGTNNAGTTQFYNITDNRQLVTSPGDTYTISAYLKLISGSLGASTGTVQLYGHYRDAGNALIGQANRDVTSDITGDFQRLSGGGQAAPAGTTNIAAKGLFVRVPDGNSINIVLRIGLPQVESGGVSTSPIVSTGSPISVAAESLQIDTPALSSAFDGAMPEELTLLINGTVTYADEDSFNTVKLIEWRVSSDDYLEISLDTSGAETGEVNFKSNLGGVFTGAQSAPDAYSPGTEVHFSIALIVTATAIEGFCNGVSTGQIAHGGMADLLSAPTKLFPVGNATLKDIRLWSEALPAADLLQAI
ncbi:hypothetical protein [Pseudophaeobacter sp.]